MDERWRTLARAASSGDTEAAARALRERLRLGALPRERVLFAAMAGHPAARLAVDFEGPPASQDLGARLRQVVLHVPLSALLQWALLIGDRALQRLAGASVPSAALQLVMMWADLNDVKDRAGADELDARFEHWVDDLRRSTEPGALSARWLVVIQALQAGLWCWRRSAGRNLGVIIGLSDTAARMGDATLEWQLDTLLECYLTPAPV